MTECIYRRVSIQKSKAEDGTAVVATYTIVAGLQVAGSGLRQNFSNGVCDLLTINDIGPVACLRPNNSERTCPDIKHLKKI